MATLLAVAPACGGESDEGGDLDAGMTTMATLSGTGTPTTTGFSDTSDDGASGEETDASASASDATAGDTTAGDTTSGDSTTSGGGQSPYTGGWDIGSCQDEVVAGQWDPYAMGPGVVLPDWYLTDRYGEMVRVRDFCHKAIYFDYSTLW